MMAETDLGERFVLDACALIAYFNDEVGAEIVEDVLERARQERAQVYVAAVNVYELFYDCLKRDETTAGQLVNDVYDLPLTVVEPLDRVLMQHAGGFKAAYRVSLADSVALGLAQRHQAYLVSSDHHEFDPIEQDGKARFWWIR
jgi:PIN domain nuclease of toxin-antitoxin system